MKFYNRETETQQLRSIRSSVYDGHSKLTVLCGRRRVGKTSLIEMALDDEPYVYLFVGKKSEGLLCRSFCQEIAAKLGLFVPDMVTFEQVFQFLMQIDKPYTLVIDEFQNFQNINSSIFSDIQNYWDQYRKKRHINFVVSGSIYSMMHRIFKDESEPLYGRADYTIHLYPFTTDVLKHILADNNPSYTPDDLLALYTFTAGIPRYVELLIDRQAVTRDTIISAVTERDSPFLDEGQYLMVQEFGKNHDTYFSILQAVANGNNTQNEIESYLGGNISIGGQLRKLEETYDILAKHRPIMARPNSQTVRYEIKDIFLKTWFHYIDNNQSLIETLNFSQLAAIIRSDYEVYSGHILEQFFRQKMQEEQLYTQIGAWWDGKSEQNEIDIVAICNDNKTAVVAEVKRHKKRVKYQDFLTKTENLQNKVLPKYKLHPVCLDLEDM